MAIFTYDQLDELGEGLIRQYLGSNAETTFCVDIEGFVTDYFRRMKQRCTLAYYRRERQHR